MSRDQHSGHLPSRLVLGAALALLACAAYLFWDEGLLMRSMFSSSGKARMRGGEWEQAVILPDASAPRITPNGTATTGSAEQHHHHHHTQAAAAPPTSAAAAATTSGAGAGQSSKAPASGAQNYRSRAGTPPPLRPRKPLPLSPTYKVRHHLL